MRYSSIDILRTIAIFVMVMVHFTENLSGVHLPITGLGAPLFALLTGVSYYLWSSGLQAKGRREQEISKISIRRGLFIFGVGFAFNILVWLPEDTFNWDVLTFIGAALLLLNLTRRLPPLVSVVMAILALVISPLLRALADYPSYWSQGYFEGELTLADLFIGFFATGYFPIFPWIAYPLTGYTIASHVFVEDGVEEGGTPETNQVRSGWQVARMGAVLIALSVVALAGRNYTPAIVSQHLLAGWTMFPATMEYVLATLGMGMLLLGLTHQCVDLNPAARKYKRALDIAKTFSRYSLTIYVLHHLVHLWPLWIYGIANGQEPTYYWMKAMPLAYSFPLAILFLAICYFIFRKIGSDVRVGIEAWMRWLCD